MTHSHRARHPTSRFALAAMMVAIFVGSSTLTRVVLLVVDRALAQDSLAEVARALGAGALFDLLAAGWLAAPLALWLALVPDRWLAARWHRRLMAGGFAVALFTAIFVAAAEYFFFDEFNGRFNFVAVDYLVYPTEVVDNIWQSYHVAWAVATVALLTALVLRWLRPKLRRAADGVTRLSQRVAFASGFGAALAVLTAAVSPGLAHVSDDRALNELASNGYYTFFEALLGADAPYEGWYASAPAASAMARVRRLLADGETVTPFRGETTLRGVDAGPGLSRDGRPPNVVVVLEESFGAKFVGAIHPETGITPHFDSLAAEGTLLTRAYSTGNRTIRALEATSSGLPPLPGVATVRRAASAGLFTLPALLRGRGYRTLFVYGGRALFDNMGAYMRANGMERVVEQKDFPAGSFTTAWGVSDEAIFDRTLAELDTLDAAGRPFYTLVLTVSNHKPYTYPPGRIAEDPAQRRRTNAVKYADWALGRFLRQARAHRFFDHTIFVVMGDHGARVYGAQEIPLPSYEVPVLLYAPGRIPARRVATMASLLDVPPTIMGLLGGRYDSRFFGTDVLRADSARGRALMTHNSEIALMRGDRMAVLGLRRQVALYAVGADGRRLVPIAAPDSAGRELVADAVAYFSQADRLYRSGDYLARAAH